MNIFECKIEDGIRLVISVNWVALFIVIAAVIIVPYIVKTINKRFFMKSIIIEEANIGIGSSSVTIKYDGRVKSIAYKIWIELVTRKIGMSFEEDNDVITEVYNSWYEAFKIIRCLLEEIPPERINDSVGLIELTTKVLNEGLRPHLTKWQAKYRKWYELEIENNQGLSPQEIQRKYPEYISLIDDLKKTNTIMIKYAGELKRIVDAK